MLIPESDSSKCTFCADNTANALWLGSKGEIYCCKPCAIDTPPQFIADAIVGGLTEAQIRNSTGATNTITKEQEILKAFHSAFSSALITKLRRSNESEIA